MSFEMEWYFCINFDWDFKQMLRHVQSIDEKEKNNSRLCAKLSWYND